MEEDRNVQNIVENMTENITNINDENTVRGMCNCECNSNNMSQMEMLKQIKCLQFAVIELAQYLDTHPDDVRALCLHRKYCNELKNLRDKYQKIYGPLTIEFPCNKWRWLESPWPWEGGIV